MVQVKKLAVKRNRQASPSPKTLEGAINIVVVESCKEAGFETYSEFIYSGDIPKLKTCVQDVYDGIAKLKEAPPGKSLAERYDNGVGLAYHLAEISEKMYKIDLIGIHSQF